MEGAPPTRDAFLEHMASLRAVIENYSRDHNHDDEWTAQWLDQLQEGFDAQETVCSSDECPWTFRVLYQTRDVYNGKYFNVQHVDEDVSLWPLGYHAGTPYGMDSTFVRNFHDEEKISL